ncbi:MAG: IS1634 family transposase, partial [Acidimicrobiales bacterium]
MYLRESKRRNKDGSTVSYLQLAHNERHPETGSPVAKVIHNFGRADRVDREALARLVSSISRFLEPTEAVRATGGSDVEVVDSRRFGGAYVLRALWERLGIAEALVDAGETRRLDADLVEQVLFALVANRCLEPTSKLAAVRWARQRVALVGGAPFDDDAAYAAMDFLLDALGDIAKGIFDRTANLLNLSCDVIFVDTSSTYFEVDVPDPLVELDTAAGERQASEEADWDHGPDEGAVRRFNKHSKDHRPDLPQVVLGMAVTAEGIPIRCWTFPGTTSDQAIIKTIKDDLAGWMLHRVVWVADSGFNSKENRAYLQGGGGHYILSERVRGGSKEAKAALARAGRYHRVAGNLEVKEVRLGDGARAQRFCVCHNPEVAARDRRVRQNLVSHLEVKIAGSDDWTTQRRDELVGELRTTPALYRLVRRTKDGKLRIDKGAIANEERFDGQFLLRTSDDTLTPTDLALAYKQLYEVERGWRDLKGALRL